MTLFAESSQVSLLQEKEKKDKFCKFYSVFKVNVGWLVSGLTAL